MSESAVSKLELQGTAREQVAHGRSRRPKILPCWGLAILLFLPGCSWIFVKPAKVDDYPNPACTRTYLAPGFDGLLAINGILAFIYYSTQKDRDDQKVLMLSTAMWSGVFAGSAYYGFSNISECNANKPEYPDDPRPPKKKPPTRLVPEPGVMRSN